MTHWQWGWSLRAGRWWWLGCGWRCCSWPWWSSAGCRRPLASPRAWEHPLMAAGDWRPGRPPPLVCPRGDRDGLCPGLHLFHSFLLANLTTIFRRLTWNWGPIDHLDPPTTSHSSVKWVKTMLFNLFYIKVHYLFSIWTTGHYLMRFSPSDPKLCYFVIVG